MRHTEARHTGVRGTRSQGTRLCRSPVYDNGRVLRADRTRHPTAWERACTLKGWWWWS